MSTIPHWRLLEKIDPRRAGNLATWLVPHRESEALLTQAWTALDAIVAMAPQAVTLQQTAPIVYLVAPALRFHPTTDHHLHCLSPDLEVVRVGLAESWRRGLRVVMRQ